MWRIAQSADDDSVVEMSLRLYSEDPGPIPVAAKNMRTTLEVLRRAPDRGRAVVLDIQGQVSGYALLIGFWSNEVGGDVCEVDELSLSRSIETKVTEARCLRPLLKANCGPLRSQVLPWGL